VVTENGEYYSDFITSPSNGLVYWVEHLIDKDGNVVDEGACGITRETTYIPGTPLTSDTFDPFQMTLEYPLYPDSGYFTRQVAKILAFGIVSVLGAWQLTDKNSWLLRSRG
jgi:hypothetical protein